MMEKVLTLLVGLLIALGGCGNCDCHAKAEDASYENNAVVVDDTGECESCQ